MSDLTLPEGSVLLHIGPHKTGTTMLQGALFQARPAMAEHGVDYVGKRRQQLAAAQFINKRNDPDASEKAWHQLVRQVADSTAPLRVVSSEGFAESDDETARHVVDQLGGDRVRILVTLRPLAKILPSAWQQYVRNRHPRPYTEWLDRTLNSPPDQQVTP